MSNRGFGTMTYVNKTISNCVESTRDWFDARRMRFAGPGRAVEV